MLLQNIKNDVRLCKCNLDGLNIMHALKPILMNYTDKLPFSGRQKVHRTITYVKHHIFAILCCH